MGKWFLISCILLLVAFRSNAQHQMWGTVASGGQYGFGYIYQVDSTGDSLRVVHHFDGVNGRSPAGKLFWDQDHKLYGLTARGGSGEVGGQPGGVLYEYDLSIDSFRVLLHFSINDSVFPFSGPDALLGLVEASPGILYGHMIINSLNTGMIYAFNTTTGMASPVVTIPTFMGGAFNTTQGNNMGNGTLYKAGDGFLYGTVTRNSQCPIPQPNQGGIVRIDPVTHNYSVLYLNPCSCNDGCSYISSFVEDGNKLYSVSKVGGIHGEGIIYEFDPATVTYTKKYDFEGGINGKQPSTLTRAGNGKFYGTAVGGTPQPPNVPGGGGIIFEYDPVTNLFSKKLDFIYTTNGNAGVGINPIGTPLILAANGKLYGKTTHGVFEYDITSNSLRPAGRYPWFGVNPAHPSLIEICRKPTYRYASTNHYIRCEGDSVYHDLQLSSPASVVWKQNGVIVPSQTDSVLRLSPVSVADTGVWVAELTNACGITVIQPVYISVGAALADISLYNGVLQAPVAESYQWIDCDNFNTPIAGETYQTFVPVSNGSYAVIISNGNNCTDTSACFAVNFVGMPEVSAASVSIFPNPAENNLQILTDEIVRSAVVYDALGRPVIYSSTSLMDVSSLAAGTYFLVIETETNRWRGTFLKM